MDGTVLTVVQETEILGNKIRMFGDINNPLFLAQDVAEWIKHSQTSKMIKSVDDEEKLMGTLFLSGQNREAWFLTEDGVYEVCMQSRKPIAKQMKKEIKKYLKSIRLTGAAIEDEQKTVDYYFSSFSDNLKSKIFAELYSKNQELQKFYDDLMNTEGLMSMNVVSKELNGFGLKRLFTYLRSKKIMFYKDNVNIPYQRFVEQGLFSVKETPCPDGKIRSVTYATKKGLEYIRKQLIKDGYLQEVA